MLALLALARPADAITLNWASQGVSGSIDDPARWSPNAVPDSTTTMAHNVGGTYTVTLSPNIPRLFQQSVFGGVVTFVNTLPHRLHFMTVSGGAAIFDGAQIVGRFPEGTTLLQDSGTLIFRNGAEFTGGGTIATHGPSAFDVSRGSRLHLGLGLDVRRFGHLNVWGAGGADGRFAGVDGGAFGISISGMANAHDGGYVDVEGPVDLVGGPTGSIQLFQVGPGSPFSDSYLNTQSTLTVGKKTGNPGLPLFSAPQLLVENRAWVHAGGVIQVGDSIGDEGCLVRVNPGGRLTASGGMKVFTTNGPAIEMRGGITHIRGGSFRWPANKLLSVSSHLEPAQLWFSNGGTNVGPSYGAPQITALVVGRGGQGVMRVTRPGTVLPVTGALSVGDSVGGRGEVVVDTSATLAVTGTLSVGGNGFGQMQVRNGSSLSAATTYLGAGPDAVGTLDVRHPGTTAVMKDKLHIGGSEVGEGGYATLSIDQGATVTVQQVGVNPSVVTVHASGGWLGIGTSATLAAGLVEVRDRLFMSNGTIQCLSATFNTAGQFTGQGTITGNLFNLGALKPENSPSVFGRLAIGGQFRQFAQGRYEVQLGTDGGPQNDTLAVTGAVTLDGTLALSPSTSFLRTPGDVYTIITGSTITGTFSSVTWNGQNVTDQVQVIYGPNFVRVVIPSGSVGVDLPSDANAGLREIHFARSGGAETIAFELTLPDAADVRVELYDAAGRLVSTLAQGAFQSGRHLLNAREGRRLPSGMYFARASVRSPKQSFERVVKAVRLR